MKSEREIGREVLADLYKKSAPRGRTWKLRVEKGEEWKGDALGGIVWTIWSIGKFFVAIFVVMWIVGLLMG